MNSDNNTIDRRNFFNKAIAWLGGITGVVICAPLINFFISPALKKSKENWIPIGELAQMNDKEPSKITYNFKKKDGWYITQVSKTVFVVKQDNNSVIVLSNKCTHLGCAVDWSSTSGHFTCPCHGGTFDKNGNVKSGPPPKQLAQISCKVEDGKILIMEG